MTDLTQSPLFKVLSEVKPLELEGAEAFKQAQRPHTGEFFPSVQDIPKDKVLRMAIEVKEYTLCCWKGTKRLHDLTSIPAPIYIPEFGIL